jgi:hypothetical protein
MDYESTALTAELRALKGRVYAEYNDCVSRCTFACMPTEDRLTALLPIATVHVVKFRTAAPLMPTVTSTPGQ